MTHCMRHYEEPEVARCRTCERPFCNSCLVFAFGPKKPPYCVGCALTASGVRNNSRAHLVPATAQPASADRRVERAQRRAEKAEAKANARAVKDAARSGTVLPDPMAAPRTSNVPVPKGLQTPASRFAPPSAEHAVN